MLISKADVTNVTPEPIYSWRKLVLRNADDNHREDHERGEEEQSSDVEEDPAIVLH